MLKRKLAVYSYIAQKRLKKQVKRLLNRPTIEVHKVGHNDEYDYIHDTYDMPLTLSRDSTAGGTLTGEAST